MDLDNNLIFFLALFTDSIKPNPRFAKDEISCWTVKSWAATQLLEMIRCCRSNSREMLNPTIHFGGRKLLYSQIGEVTSHTLDGWWDGCTYIANTMQDTKPSRLVSSQWVQYVLVLKHITCLHMWCGDGGVFCERRLPDERWSVSVLAASRSFLANVDFVAAMVQLWERGKGI